MLKKTVLKWIFDKYKTTFNEFYVDDLLYGIPDEVNDEAVTFLLKGKRKLERWFLFQAYNISKRIPENKKDPQYYYGGLAHVKALLWIIGQGSDIPEENQSESPGRKKKIISPMDRLKKFQEGMAKKIKEQKEKPVEENKEQA